MDKHTQHHNWLEGIDIDALLELIESPKTYGYREFCRLLNIAICPSGSNSQIKQLNELSMICEYEKIRRKYNFISLRTADEITLYNQKALYIPLIELCLAEKFIKLKDKQDNNFQNGILYFSLSTLIRWCGIANENFQVAHHGTYESKKIICLKHDFSWGEFNKFISVSYNKLLKPLLRSALRSLDNSGSIVIHKAFRLFNISANGYITYKNLLSSSWLGQQLEHIVAQVYTEFNIKQIQELFFMSATVKNQFYERCNTLCQNQLGYTGFYDCYAITVNWNRLRFNIAAIQEELNQRIQHKFQNTNLLKEITPESREKFILSMIDLDSPDDYNEDLLEYSQFKHEKGESYE